MITSSRAWGHSRSASSTVGRVSSSEWQCRRNPRAASGARASPRERAANATGVPGKISSRWLIRNCNVARVQRDRRVHLDVRSNGRAGSPRTALLDGTRKSRFVRETRSSNRDRRASSTSSSSCSTWSTTRLEGERHSARRTRRPSSRPHAAAWRQPATAAGNASPKRNASWPASPDGPQQRSHYHGTISSAAAEAFRRARRGGSRPRPGRTWRRPGRSRSRGAA